jgi:hypothetical protein
MKRRILAIAFLVVCINFSAQIIHAQAKCLCVVNTSGLLNLFFGMTQTQAGGGHNPTVTIPVMRLWDTNVGGSPACEWAGIETSPGTYNFTNCDVFTDRAAAIGAKWEFAMGRTPCSQIATPVNCAGSYAPNGGCQAPADLNGANVILPNFVTALVNHWLARYPSITGNYIGGVNEADLSGEWCQASGSGNGSMVDLVKYQTTLKTTAQALDPTLVILHPSASTYNQFGPHLYGPATGNTPGPGSGYLQTSGAAAAGDAFDLHPYSFCGVSINCPDTTLLSASMTAAATLFNSFGLGNVPIIDSEVNWGKNANAGMTDTQREAWIVQFEIQAWDFGHFAVWWYQWECPSGILSSCYGTISGSGVGSGVATAYTTGMNWMVGSQHVKGSCNKNVDGHNTWSCPFTTNTAAPAAFLFNIAGSQTVSVAAGFTTQFNLDGSSSAIVAHSVTVGTLPIKVQ